VLDGVSISRTEVTDLKSGDLESVHDLRCRAADFFVEVGDDPPSIESLSEDLDDLPDGFSRSDEVMYRAYRNGVLLGYAEVLRGFARPGQWIIGIVLVDEASRGQGIGRALVDAVARDAQHAGADSLAAGVIASRGRSLRFWNREGFTVERLRRPITVCGVETDVIRLERALDGHAE
jgi:GNAT superfamily N-acetyltransferase